MKHNFEERSANGIKNNKVIFSDDPTALVKLREKLKTLESLQEYMKEANKCVKKKDKEAFMKLRFGNERNWNDLIVPNCHGNMGFPRYALSNNNGNIRSVKKRIEYLESVEGSTRVELRVVPVGECD
jgi:hypothetical protein